MAKITTDFAGAENASTRTTRLKSVYDYYYGSGAFVAEGNLGGVRGGMNDITATDFSNGAAFASWLARANYLNDPDNVRAELATTVSTTKGGFWDFTDSSKIWDDAAGTDPIIAGDQINLITAYALGTADPVNWFRSAADGPVWQTTYADFNGSSHLLGASTNLLETFRNVSSGVFAASFRADTLSAIRPIGRWRVVSGGTTRLGLMVNTDGSVSVRVKRLDADSLTTITSAAGLITAGQDHTLIATVDWATGGAGAVRAYIDGGADVLNGTLTGSGATSDTSSEAASLGFGESGEFLDGRLYRVLAANFLPTAAQRAMIHGVLKGAYN